MPGNLLCILHFYPNIGKDSTIFVERFCAFLKSEIQQFLRAKSFDKNRG